MENDQSASGPLAGLFVLDLTRVLAGPFATMVLADLGACVIKVEMPEVGDDARGFGPFINGVSSYFASLNRGKQSIALNLKQADDRVIFDRLLGKADILVENYRPGTMDKLGYDWAALQRQNPRLIYCSISGFGHTGPYRHRPAYDMVVQAMGGMMSITGDAGAPPTRVGASIGDITAGLFGLSGVLAALWHRERSGEGGRVDIGMLDCQVAILENAIGRYLAAGEIPVPLGARHPSITPFAAFQTRDERIVIAAGNDVLFARLCREIDRPQLATQAEFASNALRTQHHQRLGEEIEAALAAQGAADWLEKLEQAGVPCGPINTVADVVRDRQVVERNMIIRTEHPQAGEIQMAGNPIKMEKFDDPMWRAPAPGLDADREAILAWIAVE